MRKNVKRVILHVKKMLQNLHIVHLDPDPDPDPVTNADSFIRIRNPVLFFPEDSRINLQYFTQHLL
jgi:hypothetical protein